jgi:hypothetical protein
LLDEYGSNFASLSAPGISAIRAWFYLGIGYDVVLPLDKRHRGN